MMLPITSLKPQSVSSAFAPLIVPTTFSGGIPSAVPANHNFLYQPCPPTERDSLSFRHQQQQRILPACSPGMAVLNAQYLRRYSNPEFAFIPLSLHDKDAMFGTGFTAHFGGFQNGLLPAPVKDEKPNQSYIGLIGKAILSSPQKKLVLSDIYNFVLTHYPYFRNKGPGWRNSIRHNLSLNECFLKVGRSPNGKGHFWAINPANLEDFSKGEYRRKRAHKRSRNSALAQKCEDPAKLKTVDENISENSTTRSTECRKEERCLDQEEKKAATIERRPRQPQDEVRKGFHIETLLGDAKPSCDVPVEYSKDNSAFTVVSQALYSSPSVSSAVSSSWSHRQTVYPDYSRHLNALANCTSKRLLKPSLH